MQTPLVSVITPVYCAQKWMDACVASVLAQTLRDFELILIDDGSTDASGALCDAWAAKDARVRVVHQPNGGVQAAVLRGLQEARAAYCAFVDSDDEACPALLETLYNAAVRENAQLAFCGAVELTAEGERPFWSRPDAVFNAEQIAAELTAFFEDHADLSYFCMAARWNKLYQTALLRAVAPLLDKTQAMGEDLVMNLLYLARCTRAVCTAQPLYRYRASDTSVMRTFSAQRVAQYRHMEVCLGNAANTLGYAGAAITPRMDGLYAVLMRQAIIGTQTFHKKLCAMREIYGIIKNRSTLITLAKTQPLHGRVALLCAAHGMLTPIALLTSIGRKGA